MISEPLFDTLISGPLARVIGEPLLAVHYWLLDCDCPTFEVNAPNATGIAKIDLDFPAATVEVTWGWEKRLRNGGMAYHLQSRLKHHDNGTPGSRNWNTSGLCRRTGSEAEPWAGAIGTPLTHVEVYGLEDSPQAIRFAFFEKGIVIAAGYAGENLMIGDGDELLVFGAVKWQNQIGREAWTTLWTAAVSDRPVNQAMEYAATS